MWLENYCFMGQALKSLTLRLPALQQHWQVSAVFDKRYCVKLDKGLAGLSAIPTVQAMPNVAAAGVQISNEYLVVAELLSTVALFLPQPLYSLQLLLLLVVVQVAESRRESALSSYVQDQLEYSKLWRMLEFGNKLDNLLRVSWTTSQAVHS